MRRSVFGEEFTVLLDKMLEGRHVWEWTGVVRVGGFGL